VYGTADVGMLTVVVALAGTWKRNTTGALNVGRGTDRMRPQHRKPTVTTIRIDDAPLRPSHRVAAGQDA